MITQNDQDTTIEMNAGKLCDANKEYAKTIEISSSGVEETAVREWRRQQVPSNEE